MSFLGGIVDSIIGLLLIAFILAGVIGIFKSVIDAVDNLTSRPQRVTRDEIRALREELRAERARA